MDLSDDWETESTVPSVDPKPTIDKDSPSSQSTKQTTAPNPTGPWKPADPTRLKIEMGLLVFIVIYIANIIRGRRANDNIANEFGRCFCTADVFLVSKSGVKRRHGPPKKHMTCWAADITVVWVCVPVALAEGIWPNDVVWHAPIDVVKLSVDTHIVTGGVWRP